MKAKFNSLLILLIGITFITITSCETADTFEDADLIGTWNIDGATADIKIDGVDIVQVLKTVFMYSETEAEAMVAIFSNEIENSFSGTIEFKEDNSYHLVIPEETENGSWQIDSDGKTLILNLGEMEKEDHLNIKTLNATSLVLQLPEEIEFVDLDDDDDDETPVEVAIEITLSK